MQDHIEIQMEMDKVLIKNRIKASVDEISGGDTVLPKGNLKIRSTADLALHLERILTLMGLVRNPKTLSYWRPLIDQAIKEEGEEQLVALNQTLTYNSKVPDQFETLLTAMTGQPATPIDVAVMKHFFWQIKRKMRGLSVKYHLMPIIWGKTGSGKSELVRQLAAPITNYMHTGMGLDRMGDDRYYEAFSKYFIVFLDEMPKVEKASVEHIKSVITAPKLLGRILGSHRTQVYPMNATFIGTSNESPSQLIKDPTGMRRFHYIKSADKMDWEAFKSIDFVGLWRAVDEGRELPYTLDVLHELMEAQEENRAKDVVELFVEEQYIKASEKNTVRAADVYEAFQQYAREGGYTFIPPKRSFYTQLIEKYGIEKHDGVGRTSWRQNPHFKAELTLQSRGGKLTGKGL